MPDEIDEFNQTNKSWIKDLAAFCKKKSESLKGDSKAVTDFFNAKNNAWFINSRFINFPARAEGLVSLLEDVSDAQKKKHKSTWDWDSNFLVENIRLLSDTAHCKYPFL